MFKAINIISLIQDKIMENLYEQQPDQYSNHLLEQQSYFQNNLSIINFIPHQSTIKNKKIGICAWNDGFSENCQTSQRLTMSSPKIQSQKKRIQDFLATIKNKNGEFVRAQFGNKKKRSSLDNYDSQNNDIFLPLNNTIISFPKSRHQTRKLEGEQKIILEKLYQKRQKSKVIPRQIQINPSAVYGTTQSKFPTKNYLAKNRSFIDEKSIKKIHNPEDKFILNSLRRRFPNSYYKKGTNVFQLQGYEEKLSAEKDRKFILNEKSIEISPESSRKLSSVIFQLQKSPIQKMYKTIQANAKFNNINLGCQKQFSISKIREDAKNTHLNRTKLIQKNEIQLLGSTIAKWKDEANKKLKGLQ